MSSGAGSQGTQWGGVGERPWRGWEREVGGRREEGAVREGMSGGQSRHPKTGGGGTQEKHPDLWRKIGRGFVRCG